MCSVNMFIKYIHFVSVDNDITSASYHLPPRLVVSVISRLVALGHEAHDVSPVGSPIRTTGDHEITGIEEVLHCLVGISVW